MRTRDLGITIGLGSPGPLNAITDVAGVRVGTRHDHRGRRTARRRPGSGADRGHRRRAARTRRLARTGLRRLSPAQRQRRADRPRMGPRIREAHHPCRDHQHAQRRRRPRRAGRGLGRARGAAGRPWSLPVVGETYDGLLNDINGFHVRAEHLRTPSTRRAAGRSRRAASAAGRGWSATSSRAGSGPRHVSSRRTVAATRSAFWSRPTTASAIGSGSMACRSVPRSASTRSPARTAQVQAQRRRTPPPGSGSIIIVVATDAPLLPHQCERVAQRAGLGLARAGGTGGHTSGDLFIAFATGNRLPAPKTRTPGTPRLRRPGRSATSSSTRSSTRPSRRPRRRSSTPSSPPRR